MLTLPPAPAVLLVARSLLLVLKWLPWTWIWLNLPAPEASLSTLCCAFLTADGHSRSSGQHSALRPTQNSTCQSSGRQAQLFRSIAPYMEKPTKCLSKTWQPKRVPVEWFCGNGHWEAPYCFALPPVPLPVVQFGLPSGVSHPARQTYGDMEVIEGTTNSSQEFSHCNQFLHCNRHRHTSFRVCSWQNIHLANLLSRGTVSNFISQFIPLLLCMSPASFWSGKFLKRQLKKTSQKPLARKDIFRYLTESYCSMLNGSESSIITDINTFVSGA